MYWTRTPRWIQKLFPKIVWSIPNVENKIYLTFDDGPSSAIHFILNELQQRGVKATFFCLGQNLVQDGTANEIIQQGHQLANHGYDHQGGWRVGLKPYVESVDKCQAQLESFSQSGKKLFRPPYGRFGLRQYLQLKKRYQVVMWSLMTGDFDQNIETEDRVRQLIEKTRSGDVIVFHDNEKSLDNLKKMLPVYLDACLARGFVFDLI